MNSDFAWILEWYRFEYADYDEHQYGIFLKTEENQSWSLSISIAETPLERQSFQDVNEYINTYDWINCSIEKNEFIGRCSVRNLSRVFQIFRKWADSFQYNIKLIYNTEDNAGQVIEWLVDWYSNCCSRGLSSRERIMISTLGNPGWNLQINLIGTELESKVFPPLRLDRTNENWFQCYIKDRIFYAPCGLYNLLEVLNVFKQFASNSRL